MFTRTLNALLGRIPPIADDVAVAEIRFDTLGYSPAERAAFMDSLESRLRADTRVHTVGFNTIAPFRGVSRRVWLPGDHADRFRNVDGGDVTPGWFDAAGLMMMRGRTFTPDEMRQANAAIVDRGFVERHGLQEPVVGTQLRVERTTSGGREARSINQVSGPAVVTVTIVGVVGNALSRPIVREPAANLYLPMDDATTYVAAYVRTNGPAGIAGQIRETMNGIDPDLPPIRIATLAARYHEDAGEFRLIASAASGLGAAALFLAVAGVYSVIAFFVSLRTHEFGIRVAIGARPSDITKMVVMEASRLVGAGLLGGLVLGVPVWIFLGKAFQYTSASDPLGVLGPVAALTLTALIGAGIPARKAARVDPCAALRSE